MNIERITFTDKLNTEFTSDTAVSILRNIRRKFAVFDSDGGGNYCR